MNVIWYMLSKLLAEKANQYKRGLFLKVDSTMSPFNNLLKHLTGANPSEI